VNAWVAHFNEEIFGSDARAFRPERWLNKEVSREQEQYYMPFGLGSRTCIGKNISMMEMAKVIPEIVRNFDIEMQREDPGWRVESRWFVYQKDFFVKLRPRGRK